MPPAALPRIRRNGSLAEDPIDPYELVRRLSAVQAEETIKELERKRNNWESELFESRGEQDDDGQDHVVTGQASSHTSQQTAPVPSNTKPRKGHKRSASLTLAPDQLPPPAYTDLPPAPRKQSLPLNNRAQSSRRPSLMRGDSALDLETINEDAVIEPSLENLFPEWIKADKQQRSKRSSMLRSVDEDHLAPTIVSTQPVSRRRSSLLSQGGASSQGSSSGRLDPWSGSDSQPGSRRQSALMAQRRHSRQDWSQSDEPSPRGRRRSSVIDKMGEYWKPAPADQGSDVVDGDGFDSRATTVRNSWRSSMGSSMGGSTSSRRASILKKVGDYWVVRPPLVDKEASVQDIHTDEEEEEPEGKTPASKKKMSGLFSKLRL